MTIVCASDEQENIQYSKWSFRQESRNCPDSVNSCVNFSFSTVSNDAVGSLKQIHAMDDFVIDIFQLSKIRISTALGIRLMNNDIILQS